MESTQLVNLVLNNQNLTNEQTITQIQASHAQTVLMNQKRAQTGRPLKGYVVLSQEEKDLIIRKGKYYLNKNFLQFLKQFWIGQQALIAKPLKKKKILKYLVKNKREMRIILENKYEIATNQPILKKLDNFSQEISKQQVQTFLFGVGDILPFLKIQ